MKPYIPALRFHGLTPFYDLLTRFLIPEKKIKHALIQQAAILPPHLVLDVGCGTLTLALLIKQRHPSAWVTAIDVDPEILKIAEKKKKDSGIIIQQYPGDQIPFPDQHFDRVVSSFVFMHLSSGQKRSTLQEIRRVLKKDGELHIADWGKPSGLLTRAGFSLLEHWIGKEQAADNAKALLPDIIRQSGFSGVRETQCHNTVFGTIRLIKAAL